MKVALTRALPGEAFHLLDSYFSEVQVFEQGVPNEKDLRSLCKDSDVVICQLTDKLGPSIFKHSQVKHVISYSVGLDHIDVAGLARVGIKVSHTPSVLTEATADLTWALLLVCARRLGPANAMMRSNRFDGFDPSGFLGIDINGARLGIIGMGRIGRAVARRASGFGMDVVFCGGSVGDSGLSAQSMELHELLETSDVVSLHCPLKESTRYLIGEDQLQLMKKRAVLINTARGPIVDEVALVAHLRRNPEFFAGLDVYENEPRVTGGLTELPNAWCLPHIGSAARRTRIEMAQICVQEAIRFAKGEPLKYEVGTL